MNFKVILPQTIDIRFLIAIFLNPIYQHINYQTVLTGTLGSVK
jgi:hypothetical protein